MILDLRKTSFSTPNLEIRLIVGMVAGCIFPCQIHLYLWLLADATEEKNKQIQNPSYTSSGRNSNSSWSLRPQDYTQPKHGVLNKSPCIPCLDTPRNCTPKPSYHKQQFLTICCLEEEEGGCRMYRGVQGGGGMGWGAPVLQKCWADGSDHPRGCWGSSPQWELCWCPTAPACSHRALGGRRDDSAGVMVGFTEKLESGTWKAYCSVLGEEQLVAACSSAHFLFLLDLQHGAALQSCLTHCLWVGKQSSLWAQEA